MPPCMAWWNPNVLCKDYWCFCILYVFLFVTGVGPTQAWETRGIISFTPNLPDPPCAKSSKTSVWTSLVRRAMTPPGRHVQPHQSDTSAENEHSFPYAFKSTGSYHYCSFIFVSLTEENGIALFSVAFFRIIRQHIFISYLCFFLFVEPWTPWSSHASCWGRQRRAAAGHNARPTSWPGTVTCFFLTGFWSLVLTISFWLLSSQHCACSWLAPSPSLGERDFFWLLVSQPTQCL